MTLAIDNSNKYFYHFTHIDNLGSIIENGLLCTNEKNRLGLDHKDVASEGIQERRSQMQVTCEPYGTVHDYVPFYWCSLNPMLLSVINSKNFDQPYIIFLAVKADSILDKNTVFTDASANTLIAPSFYTDSKDLDKLDWAAINSKKWSPKDKNELHRRMSEVLIYKNLKIEQIASIVVWNDHFKDKAVTAFEERGIKPPNITFQPFQSRYFYFTKFMIGRSDISLITGPRFLKISYMSAIRNIGKQRKLKPKNHSYKFDSIDDTLTKLDKDFCAILELKGIFQLETQNEMHSENVSDHTLKVVHELEKLKEYKTLDVEDQNILKLSAYLHDIGKGPKSKWPNEVQSVYPDHPADAPEMLERILTDDIKNISPYEIGKVCLLVTYHDLIGEIMFKGRSIRQLKVIIEDEKELLMLSLLNWADVTAISPAWAKKYREDIVNFREDFHKNYLK